MVEKSTIILVAAIVAALAIALPIVVIQMTNIWRQPVNNPITDARDDPNYVAVNYLNNTAKITLREGQTTDFVSLVYVDDENQIAQFDLTSPECFGAISTEAHVLKAGENVTSCSVYVTLIDVPSPDSATLELRQGSCFCPICWHLVFGNGRPYSEFERMVVHAANQ